MQKIDFKKEAADLLKEQGVQFALLFGSRALEKANENSDYDIAVFFASRDKKARFESKLYLSGKLPSILKKDVDIVILNDIRDNYLLGDILVEGKLIYTLDEGFSFKYLTDKLHEVCDFLSHVEYVNKEISNYEKN